MREHFSLSHFIQIKTKNILKQISSLGGAHGNEHTAGQAERDVVERKCLFSLKSVRVFDAHDKNGE